jgi:hypothetical protein
MNKQLNTTLITLCIVCFNLSSVAQNQIIKPDLSNSTRFQLVNREITVSASAPGKVVVHLNSKAGNGVAWIKDLTFEKGTIEFDVKGKNILQQSFVGIAFHGLDDSTYDAVYFRPFNFQSSDTIRKSHSVQYISLPQYDWSVLREKHPGKYENALVNTIDPENWFHARIIIDADNIVVYVNDDKKPSLLIKPITNRTKGRIGFWVGNNSDSDFSNLSIQNKK